jgi:hypothetical protein
MVMAHDSEENILLPAMEALGIVRCVTHLYVQFYSSFLSYAVTQELVEVLFSICTVDIKASTSSA